MGAGKSTVAHRVAERLGLRAIDLDKEIDRHAGRPVAKIFADEGEAGFRRIERELLAQLGEDGVVIALGGGAVVDRETRHSLIDRGVLITLMAPLEVLAARVSNDRNRPLIGDDAEESLRVLLEAREDAYAEAHAVIDTSTRSLDQTVDGIVSVALSNPVLVPLGKRSYCVEIGKGVRCLVGDRVNRYSEGSVLVVHDGGADRPWPRQVIDYVGEAGRLPIAIEIPGNEASKNVRTVELIWDAALNAEVDRHAMVVGVGGGVVGDMTAFAASTLLRGLTLGQVPTTLLSMVDSSVGGKTGFNRSHGKNLVGSFYQPKFVLCDVETLSTLSDDERISGLAEVVKSAWLDGEASVALLEADAAALVAGDAEATIRAVQMSVRLKSKVVRQDEREAGHRMLLNLGHTVGHGLEAAANYTGIKHGEAVALGMVAAMRLAKNMGEATADAADRLVRLVERLGLPVDLDAQLSDEALAYIAADKKRRGGEIRFVIPGLPGQTQIRSIPISTLQSSLREH